MAAIVLPFSFSPNTLIESAKVNSDLTTIYNDYNGSITDANVSSLSESKVTFAATGHAHTGAAGGAPITVARRVLGLTGANNAVTPNTKVDLAADAVTLVNSSGNPIVKTNTGTLTCDVTTAGPAANGRDQAGAFGASTWIHFYFIYNPTTDTLATVSSLTAPPTGPTLPSGYTHWAYAAAVRYNATPILVTTWVRGAWMTYGGDVRVMSNGVATVEAAVDLSTFVPPNVAEARYRLELVNSTASNQSIAFRIVSGAANNYGFKISEAANLIGDHDIVAPVIAQKFFYLNDVATISLTVNVLGYSVPNGG